MSDVERRVDEELRKMDPILRQMIAHIQGIEREDVRVSALVYAVMKLVGESKLPAAMSIGVLEIVKTAFTVNTLNKIFVPDASGMNYVV